MLWLQLIQKSINFSDRDAVERLAKTEKCKRQRLKFLKFIKPPNNETGCMKMNFLKSVANISLHYPALQIFFYCLLLQIHVRLNYTFVCVSVSFFCEIFFTVGKLVCENINFHVDLCAQRPELHRFNTAMYTDKMEIFHSPLYNECARSTERKY